MFADNNVNFEARKMSVYNQRWNDEQQAVPRAPRHDRHPGSGHPANLPANIRVLRPPAPERPDELDALPEENHDAEVFIYCQALCPFLCLCVQKFKKMDTD